MQVDGNNNCRCFRTPDNCFRFDLKNCDALLQACLTYSVLSTCPPFNIMSYGTKKTHNMQILNSPPTNGEWNR